MSSQEIPCLLCQNKKALRQTEGRRDFYWFDCPACGSYGVSRTLDAVMNGSGGANYKQNAYIASGLARELAETNMKAPEFTTDNFGELISRYPVPDVTDVHAKTEKLLARICEKTDHFGQGVKLEYETDYPLAYGKNKNEFEALLGLLGEEKLIQRIERRADGVRVDTVVVTAAGWSLVRSLKSKNLESEQGFVAIWFNDEMNESIASIERAITDAGFKPLCIRSEHFKDKIMDKALSEIRKSRFIVVDLTGVRSSVFFEAGFAFGLGIEAFYVYKADVTKGLEFYVRHYQCYPYTDADDLREKLKAAIGARIKK